MKLFKVKSKLKLSIIITFYVLLILTLLIPIKGYEMDLPGNINSIKDEIKIENLDSTNEFYSIYIITYNRPTLFQLLVAKLSKSIDVYPTINKTSSSENFFRGALLEELSFQYAIITAYKKASIIDDSITIDYNLDSYVITYSVNKDISVGMRFIEIDNISINTLTLEEIINYLKNHEEVTLTVFELNGIDTKEITIKKTDGLFGINFDKYFKINDSNPTYKTFYEKDQKVGPSGGLLQTLEIYTTLLGLKFNKKIAGTGTINSLGEVGPIGGIKQKVFTANKKVDIFLVPEVHYLDALKAYNKINKPTFKLVKVRDFDEALEKLLSES